MSEENVSVDPAPVEDPTTGEVAQIKSFDEAYVRKLRDEAAGYRVKLKEFEDRDKSEFEKQAERLATLEKENTTFRQRDQIKAWAEQIVNGSKVPASALRGSSEEELREHFDQLKSLIPEEVPQKTVVPIDLSGGGKTSVSGADAFAAALEGLI